MNSSARASTCSGEVERLYAAQADDEVIVV
jgi:hypothetical protein